MRLSNRLIVQIRILAAVALVSLQSSLATVHAHEATLVVPVQFPTIQAAINAASPGEAISVLPGTYVEQLEITKNLTIEGSGVAKTVIKAPQTLVPFASGQCGSISTGNPTFDALLAQICAELTGSVSGTPLVAIVQITNGAHVTMSDLTVAGPVAGMCASASPRNALQRPRGISVVFGATLTLTDSRVTAIRDDPMGLCETGIGIYVGESRFTLPPNGLEGHATIENVLVDDYENNGINVAGKGSSGVVSGNVVRGAGPVSSGQTGIEIFEAVATVTENSVSGNLCIRPVICGPDFINQFQSCGICPLGAEAGTVISENKVFNNDLGITVGESVDCCTVTENRLTDNPVDNLAFADGSFTAFENVITGGGVGILVAALGVNTIVVLRENVIRDTTGAPIQTVACCGVTATYTVVSDR